ncbi:unnamed protein product, partial [Medioppia subpectinata]
MSDHKDKRMRACVIGAGAAGLCAARHLSQYQSVFTFDVYEKTAKVGGVWNYTDSVGLDTNGLPIHTSLYRNMRTNIPMEIMEFQDFASNCETSFVSHTRVLQYLEDYAKHFNLYQYIKFNHQIISVSRSENVWKIMVKNITTGEISEHIYDSVFVCNGKFSIPFIPTDIKGLHTFKGQVLHTHDYRVADGFEGKVVLVLGGGPSGVDISIEVSEIAKQVIFCHRNAEPFLNLSESIVQELSEIHEITETGVELKNGNQYKVNTILLATGYQLDLSFLDKSCAINVTNSGRVEGIYLHFINQTYPSMAIWAICRTPIPFPYYHIQVSLFIKYLTRELELPSIEEMESHIQRELSYRKSMGLSERHCNKISQSSYDYCHTLTQMANIKPLSPVVNKLHDDIQEFRKQDIIGYKNMNFSIISDEQYCI